MITRGLKIAYLDSYKGSTSERKYREGLSYDYMIMLRRVRRRGWTKKGLARRRRRSEVG